MPQKCSRSAQSTYKTSIVAEFWFISFAPSPLTDYWSIRWSGDHWFAGWLLQGTDTSCWWQRLETHGKIIRSHHSLELYFCSLYNFTHLQLYIKTMSRSGTFWFLLKPCHCYMCCILLWAVEHCKDQKSDKLIRNGKEAERNNLLVWPLTWLHRWGLTSRGDKFSSGKGYSVLWTQQ